MQTARVFRLTSLGALGATLLIGAAGIVVAQPPTTTPGQPGEISRGERQGARGRDAQRGPRGNRGGDRRDLAGQALFRDITLTDTQKSQVQAIRTKYAEQRQTLAKELRDKAGMTKGQRPDSAARAQLRARLQTEARAGMDRQVAELRGVLTADQRVTFDKNLSSARERLQSRVDRAKQKGVGRRAFRRDA